MCVHPDKNENSSAYNCFYPPIAQISDKKIDLRGRIGSKILPGAGSILSCARWHPEPEPEWGGGRGQ